MVTSISALVTAVGAAMYMHSYQNGNLILLLGSITPIASMSVWWRDVIREATFNGYHTKAVQLGLRYGMILFITTEVTSPAAFSRASSHSSLSPSVEIGAI